MTLRFFYLTLCLFLHYLGKTEATKYQGPTFASNAVWLLNQNNEQSNLVIGWLLGGWNLLTFHLFWHVFCLVCFSQVVQNQTLSAVNC